MREQWTTTEHTDMSTKHFEPLSFGDDEEEEEEEEYDTYEDDEDE